MANIAELKAGIERVAESTNQAARKAAQAGGEAGSVLLHLQIAMDMCERLSGAITVAHQAATEAISQIQPLRATNRNEPNQAHAMAERALADVEEGRAEVFRLTELIKQAHATATKAQESLTSRASYNLLIVNKPLREWASKM